MKLVAVVHFVAIDGWRCELWERPYRGQMVACTRWVQTRRQARADGKRFFHMVVEG